MFSRFSKPYPSVKFSLSYRKAFSTSPAQLSHIYQPCTQSSNNNPANLIVLHGVLGSSKNFRGITHSPKIATKVNTYLLDLRNHGKAEHRDSMTYQEMSDDLYNFFSENQLLDTVNIVMGHSMGARLAMEFVIRYPELSKGVIIVDLAPYKYLEDKSFTYVDSMYNMLGRFVQIDVNRDPKLVKKDIIAAAEDKDVGELVATNVVPDGHGGHMWRINMEAIHGNFKTQILNTEYKGAEKYDGPVKVILGGESEYTGPEVVSSYETVFSNIDLGKDVEFVDKAAHWVHFSQPQKFIQIVSDFLDKVLKR